MGGSNEWIRAEFAKRLGRQHVATTASVLLVIGLAVLYARPGWLGPNLKDTIFAAQAVVIAAFVGFTYVNWRCPACKKHLGPDLQRRVCGTCRTKLG